MLKKIRSLVSNSSFNGVYDNVLSSKECQLLIDKFEKGFHTPGKSARGYNPANKETIELQDTRFSDSSVISGIVSTRVDQCLTKYSKTYKLCFRKDALKINDEYIFSKIEKGGGFKRWHSEQGPGIIADRTLVFILYLNNAQSGTEFLYYPTIKAKEGRCILFPASYTHTHKSEINKNLKYIITGWISYK